MIAQPRPPVEWVRSPGLVDYEAACALMAERVDAIAAGKAAELVWLLEHPPLYTAGTSAKAADLIEPGRFPVHRSGRGGQFTYHGPGQRVGYVMLDVGRRWGDVRAYVHGARGADHRRAGVARGGGAHPQRPGRRLGAPAGGGPRAARTKIAAIGVRLRRWVSSHGFSINVAPDLAHFSGIVPCGIRDDGVTSLAELGSGAGLEAVDDALRRAFERRIGPTCEAAAGTFAATPRPIAHPRPGLRGNPHRENDRPARCQRAAGADEDGAET